MAYSNVILDVLDTVYRFITQNDILVGFVTPIGDLISDFIENNTGLPTWLADTLRFIADSVFNTSLTPLELCLFAVVAYGICANIVKFFLGLVR